MCVYKVLFFQLSGELAANSNFISASTNQPRKCKSKSPETLKPKFNPQVIFITQVVLYRTGIWTPILCAFVCVTLCTRRLENVEWSPLRLPVSWWQRLCFPVHQLCPGMLTEARTLVCNYKTKGQQRASFNLFSVGNVTLCKDLTVPLSMFIIESNTWVSVSQIDQIEIVRLLPCKTGPYNLSNAGQPLLEASKVGCLLAAPF